MNELNFESWICLLKLMTMALPLSAKSSKGWMLLEIFRQKNKDLGRQ